MRKDKYSDQTAPEVSVYKLAAMTMEQLAKLPGGLDRAFSRLTHAGHDRLVKLGMAVAGDDQDRKQAREEARQAEFIRMIAIKAALEGMQSATKPMITVPAPVNYIRRHKGPPSPDSLSHSFMTTASTPKPIEGVSLTPIRPAYLKHKEELSFADGIAQHGNPLHLHDVPEMDSGLHKKVNHSFADVAAHGNIVVPGVDVAIKPAPKTHVVHEIKLDGPAPSFLN